MLAASNPQISICLNLTRAISRTRTVEEIYTAALDTLAQGLGVARSAILLFDPDGVMRFKAHRGSPTATGEPSKGTRPGRPIHRIRSRSSSQQARA